MNVTKLAFVYSSRAALIADGWHFTARTAGGGSRNTEQAGALAISYDQTVHPGRIRIPLGSGELWQALNSSQNMLFRDLPADWTSIRLRVASFSPAADFQQVGLLAYQDDDTYVNVQRNFNAASGGPVVGFFREVGGATVRSDRRPLTSTGNLILRLDRDASSNTFTAFYSVDAGGTWVPLTGAHTLALASPRLAIQVGANLAGGAPTADLEWIEIHRPDAAPPAPGGAPALTGCSPSSGTQGTSLTVVVSGTGFVGGASCTFGSGITVTSLGVTSPTQLTASLSIAPAASVGSRVVTLVNPDSQSASLAGAFAVSPASAPQASVQTGNLTVAVLVNSTNPAGFSTNPASPGEFQRYPQLYLDHLQVPYETFDVAAAGPPADLATRHLIVAGHAGLNPSAAWGSAIVAAVAAGTGFVNLDSDLAVGGQSHIRTIFGATGATSGAPASTITVPAAVAPGGAALHFVTGLQRRFLDDPTGDITYAFHPDGAGVVQGVAPTVLTGAGGTVVARLGASPLILCTVHDGGRAVHFGTYRYLKADRFGFVQGVDDLFWRSLVWAARKPFVLRGYPRFWSVQMDDTMPGWGGRVRDLYDTALTGVASPTGTGGPWKVTGYVFTNNLPPGSAERAGVIAEVQAGRLRISPHNFDNIKYGTMYWNGATGPLTDAQWSGNLAAIQTWKAGQGGADAIPAFSRSFVAHYWDISNNVGHDIWNTLGMRCVTTIQKPGFRYPDKIDDITVYTGDGSERLRVRPHWLHELPPKKRASENFPFFIADEVTIGSRAGLAPRTFVLFSSQYVDLARYTRNDFIWPSTTNAQSVAKSLDQLQRYTWRHWSGLSPMQLYTHDIINYQLASPADRRAVIAQASTWLNEQGARHVFMDDLGDYIHARTKSVLTRARLVSGALELTFTGRAVTADQAPMATEALVFYQDAEGRPVTVAGFGSATTVTVPLPPPPPSISGLAPTSGPAAGGTSVTISGANLAAVTAVEFAGVPASITSQSATQVVAVCPAGSGVVDVRVTAAGASATRAAAFTYVSPPPTTGHFDLTYPSRAALLGDGWSFTARTASGGSRNTEGAGVAAVSYNQATHPGVIRIPVVAGELWQALNSSQNMLSRGLPAGWTSIRLKIAAFNPVADFQQVGLLAYQDDDTYANVQRNFNASAGGAVIGFFTEVAGAPVRTDRRPLANTGNLILRLDRAPTTNTLTAFYSLNEGASWVQLTGAPVVPLANPRLAIQVGANTSVSAPSADLAWAEIL